MEVGDIPRPNVVHLQHKEHSTFRSPLLSVGLSDQNGARYFRRSHCKHTYLITVCFVIITAFIYRYYRCYYKA